MLGQIGLPGGGFGFGYGATGGNGHAAPAHAAAHTAHGSTMRDSLRSGGTLRGYAAQSLVRLRLQRQRQTYPDIHLVYWCGGNPFHKVQDLNRLLRAWQHPETIIVHEPWWTPSARRADIVLPCTTTMERNDIGVSLADGCYFAMQQAIAPVGQARTEYDIYSALAARLGFRSVLRRGAARWSGCATCMTRRVNRPPSSS